MLTPWSVPYGLSTFGSRTVAMRGVDVKYGKYPPSDAGTAVSQALYLN